MNKNNELSKELPPDTKIIQVDVVGAITKRRFMGEFKCRIPTLEDQSSMARFEATLNGESTALGTSRINKMIAYLKYTVLESPISWRESNMGHRLRDPNVVEEVYNQVLAFEDQWLKEVWGEDEDEDGPTEEKEE